MLRRLRLRAFIGWRLQHHADTDRSVSCSAPVLGPSNFRTKNRLKIIVVGRWRLAAPEDGRTPTTLRKSFCLHIILLFIRMLAYDPLVIAAHFCPTAA